jgi:alpha-mannosidase
LYPHAGGWKDALTIRQGYELNYKLLSMPVEKHEGALAPEHSFLHTQNENIIVTSLKKAEDDDSLVLRFYEWAGKDGEVQLEIPPGAQSASETDLMEKSIGNAGLQNNMLAVHAKPYSIETVKIQYAPASQAAEKP